MTKITSFTIRDVRFPTSLSLDGSDAMNPNPDYSAAYVVLHTDTGAEGHGFTFTIGRGNDICCAAIAQLGEMLVGTSMEEVYERPGKFWRRLGGDSQLRWLGPEKGVIHLALAALTNAVWDLWAKLEDKPLWKLLVDLPPETIVAAIDFRHISDALTPAEAVELLTRQRGGIAEREAYLRRSGYPAYTTAPGWYGYDDAKVRRLCREALEQGFESVKLKVGGDEAADLRRAGIIRECIGNRQMTMDANQVWDVDGAIVAMQKLAVFDPYWIEEPTSPDDVLGHARIAQALRPIKVGTGEHAHNRVMFKQFFQAKALDICQLDACRLGGVNEVLAVVLLARQFDVPLCPHGGGVGLCELVQHVSFFDYVAVSGKMEGRVIEYVGHLHEHLVDPVLLRDGRYYVTDRPGYSTQMLPDSLEAHLFPGGAAWRS